MKEPFSWKKARNDVLNLRLRQRKILARGGAVVNADFARKHPDWVRDAQNKQYTVLEKVTKDEFAKQWKEYDDRQNRIYGS